jgi:hypothetical protein
MSQFILEAVMEKLEVEFWLHNPKMQAKLARAAQWMDRNPPCETALSEQLPAYEPDAGPLTAGQLVALRDDAAKHMPQGKTIFREDLFE